MNNFYPIATFWPFSTADLQVRGGGPDKKKQVKELNGYFTNEKNLLEKKLKLNFHWIWWTAFAENFMRLKVKESQTKFC